MNKANSRKVVEAVMLAEKLKPSLVIVASKPGKGKKVRIELYRRSLWRDRFPYRTHHRYRVRFNGKWADGGNVNDQGHTISNVIGQLRGWLKRG